MITIRNRHIRFDRDAINDVLGKSYTRESEDYLCDYAVTLAQGNWDIPGMTGLLLLPGCTIAYGKTGLPLRAKGEDMTPVARLTLLFFLHNVIPHSHISDVTMPILGLIYCLFKGSQVDIAKHVERWCYPKKPIQAQQPAPPQFTDQQLMYHLMDQNAANHCADVNLYEAMYQMSLNQPLYEPSHFYAQVAWPGDRPQFGDGVGTSDGANAVVMMTRLMKRLLMCSFLMKEMERTQCRIEESRD
ncbi:hypothetical protein TSUD_55690 [Trifolium subterraneum]|uniref:Putative plant transposon protein domain-containing protein n=1 Tax=Trifolium subterraneum TaxID=3900 RepID=A0A2Z6MY14_TRISU|nr:hypothetical protein TSUD_55690 [Trifolium subterraneum]